MTSKSSADWKHVFDSVTDSIILLDVNGKMQDCNEAFIKLTNKTKPEILSSNCFWLIHGETTRPQDCPFFKSTKTKKRETLIINKFNKWLKVDLDPILDENNNITGFIHFIKDITESKQNEQKQYEQNLFISTLLDNLKVGVVACDANGKLTYFNKTTQKFHGLPQKKIGSDQWAEYYDLYFSDGKTKMQIEDIPLFKALKGKQFNDIEMMIKPKKQGKSYTLAASGSTIFDSDGNKQGAVVSMYDIGERKKTEEEHKQTLAALQESEDRLSKTLIVANDGMWDWDLVTNKVYFDPRYYKMAGYNVDEFPHKFDEFEKRVHPDDIEHVIAQVQLHLTGKNTHHHVEFRFKKKNGDWLWIKGLGLIVERDKTNKPLRFIGTHTDITEQKNAEDAIKESEIKFRGIYEQSPIAIELYDKKGKLIDVNQTTLDIFGVKDKKYVLGFDLWADPNLKGEKLKQLKGGNEIFISTDFDFDVVKAKNLYPTSRSGKMFIDMYSLPLKDGNEIIGYLVQIVETTVRRHAKEELQKSKNLLNATQLLSKVGGWKWNVEDQTMYWTDETYRIHEVDPTEIEFGSTKHIEQGILCYDKKDRKIIMDVFQKCIDSGESYDLEFPFTTFKGNRIWIRTIAKAEKENGKVVSVIGNIMDITERKKIEEDLKNSEERLKIMFESAPDAYYLNDSKGIFIDGNKAVEKLLGYKKEELIGKNLLTFKLLSAKQLPKASKILLKNIQGKSSGPDEFALNRKDGKQVTVAVTTHPTMINKKPVILGIAHDITKRKQAEYELREAKEFAENLLETANSIVITLDVHANIVTFNKYAEELSGYKKDEVLGKNWFDIFLSTEDKQIVPDVLTKALQSMPEAYKNENEILQKNGEKIVISWNNNVIRNEYGEISGLLSIGMDVTERNKARDELKEYAETQKVLLREVNHRVKNNLSALISMLHKGQDHAEEKGLDSSTVLAVLEERINGLANVHSLLSESEWKPIKLSVLCKQIVSGSMSNLILTDTVRLIINKSEFMIDSNLAHHLTMVLNELAINTLKYALAKRDVVTITINIKKNKDKIELCFCDDGPGYPKKLLKGDLSDIGVGFELIRGIVKQSMGGDLQITNDDGAKAIITFRNG